MEIKNYKIEEKLISATMANIYGLLMMIPVCIVFVTPFYLIWPDRLRQANFEELFARTFGQPTGVTSFFVIILIFLVSVVLHELIHGITWSLFTKNGFSSIRFGINWKMLMPYRHCKEPLLLRHYITGAIMPFILLGLVPTICAIFTGSFLLLVTGLIMTISAIGDFMIIALIRKYPGDTLVLDHPNEAGCYIYLRENG